MLKFPDNTMVAVKGLDDIMAELYAENRKANNETAKEMITRLEEKKNFIPSSDSAQREYTFVLLREFRKYIKNAHGVILAERLPEIRRGKTCGV